MSSTIIKYCNSLQLPRVIIAARCFLFFLVIWAFSELTTPETPTIVLQLSAFLGILLGSTGACSRLTGLAGALIIILGALAFYLLSNLIVSADGLIGSSSMLLFRLSEHLDLIGFFLLYFAATTWSYLRSRTWIFVESLLLLIASAQLLATHRNLRFDSPQWIADFSWWLGVSQLTGLIVVGVVLLVGLTSYLAIGSVVTTEMPRPTRLRSNKRLIWPHFLTVGIVFTLCLLVSREIHRYYTNLAGDRLANGVGQTSKTGESPLSFYSSLGGSSEPSALLRLESDYLDNPLQPMLYLRENALSEMGFLGLTVGNLDDDIPRTSPLKNYAREQINDYVERKEVQHSIYLMSDHETAFAIDYPISIVPLKNPNKSRFVAAFRATSLAPAFPKERLDYVTTGNPSWDPKTLKYYTTPHPDSRYADKAVEITKASMSDIEKAFAITEYFNKNAIYTLSPDHKVGKDDDPVAPFLFGDMRGYCVHFAHATVYMLRSLGIPARIGTGYLTDLSQSKDGHILLRMSDRHAWAEVYVTERGWLPFDTMPEQVESHANTDMNMELLEELMGLLDPGEEILPENIVDDEPNVSRPSLLFTPSLNFVLVALLLFLVALGTTKTYLLFGWRLAKNPKTRLKLAYRTIIVRLYDLGIVRSEAETRKEFSLKLSNSEKTQEIRLTMPLLETVYGQSSPSISNQEIDRLLDLDLQQIRDLAWHLKLKTYLNPASVLAFWGGKGW